MADDFSGSVDLRDVAIVGGGCYGTFYARQLIRAAERGKARYRRLLVVDREAACRFSVELGPGPDRELVVAEWSEFFDRWLDRPGDPRAGSGDAIVPSPLMPHLMYEWLLRRARARWPGRAVEQRPLAVPVGTPYDTAAPDGTRYVSYADWLCPTHCVEPAICPVIRAPRTWEMGDAMEQLVGRLSVETPTAGPALFVCRHRTFGVGMFDVAEVLGGDRLVAEAGARPGEVDVVVGTVSGCHGAVSLLHLGSGRSDHQRGPVASEAVPE
ncbi:MAG TPA: hypothetical protein VHG35_10560 [Gemmatimonadales bacterium]|nr:hypothetical protein [Gemmatimonadales bacterium]